MAREMLAGCDNCGRRFFSARVLWLAERIGCPACGIIVNGVPDDPCDWCGMLGCDCVGTVFCECGTQLEDPDDDHEEPWCPDLDCQDDEGDEDDEDSYYDEDGRDYYSPAYCGDESD